MISDYCSRHPVKTNSTSSFTEDYVNFLSISAVPDSLTLAEIAEATRKDKVLCSLINALSQNKWHNQSVQNSAIYQQYRALADELTSVKINDNYVVLRGSRLCIPESMRS
ncbi:hypothetical protein DPMN_106055 [Dreissena polymorpha]|uniref:Uncharacterized protein n=1 Tax=Dreissena polymorpha TaxID=45954 RepID=A0A9D4K4B4_DREPO|nr:hypothetical protein DPMN_106055 [Dreissena polymorpha]